MLRVLIIGAGMYVSGRGTSSYGTILPSLLESYKEGKISKIGIVTTNKLTALNAKRTFNELTKKMSLKVDFDYFPNQNIKSYLSAIKVFKPDASVVCVPDHLHSKISIDIMNKGVHTLVVKPMTTNILDAKLMIKAAKKNKVIGQVEFHKRFDESNITMKDIISRGKLGNLLYAVIEYSQQKIIPTKIFKKWSSKTNVFQYLGIHYVDLLQWATNYKPIRVTAWGQKKFLVSKGINTWDSMQVNIEWSGNNNQFVSSHITNWIDPNTSSAISDQKINIVGTNGRYQSDQKNRGIQVVTDKNGVSDINPYFTGAYLSDINKKKILNFDGYGVRSIKNFINNVHNLKNNKTNLRYISLNSSSFVQCIYSTAVVEAAKESIMNNNKTIKIKL